MTPIDYNDSIVVLGSGLSGTTVAETLLLHKKKVVMIDVGYEKNNNVKKKEFLKYKKKFSSPKFKLKEYAYAYSNFFEYNKIKENNFNAIGSLAKGGLSNIWGASLQPYDENDLKDFPYNLSHIKNNYKRLTSTLLNKQDLEEDCLISSRNIDHRCRDLHKGSKKIVDGITFNLPFNAVAEESSKYISKDTIYNASMKLKELKQDKNFTYVSNKFISNIHKISDIYTIICKDILSNDIVNYKSKKIFICLGTISTTHLVLKMMNRLNFKLPLLSTPAGSFMLFSFTKRKHNEKKLVIANLTFMIERYGPKASGHLFPFTDSIGELLQIKNYFPFLYRVFDYLIFSRIIIGNIYYPSKLSDNSIYLDSSENLIINGNNKRNLKAIFSMHIKKIRKLFFKNNLLLIPGAKLLNPGEDIHYGGTLPISNKYEISCNENGELKGFKNIFIADSSSMPYLPGKTHSFNAMAQSMFIAEKALENDINKI